jgi:arsenite methyltransferase
MPWARAAIAQVKLLSACSSTGGYTGASSLCMQVNHGGLRHLPTKTCGDVPDVLAKVRSGESGRNRSGAFRYKEIPAMIDRSTEEIQQAVRKKYAEVSCSAAGRFRYPTGKAGAIALGYDLSALSDLPDDVFNTFCGVGNPFALGPIQPGEKVLDVGCGAGLDMILARRLVGPIGRVCGIDLTPEMVEKAQANFVRARADNASAVVAGSDAIPYDDDTFDVVISNGVLNLSPLKERSLQEIFRVIKPNGRLQFADIVLNEDLPAEMTNSLEAWSD